MVYTGETDYAVHPGEFIAEWVEDEDIEIQHLAVDLGRPVHFVKDLLDGEVALTEDIARDIAAVSPFTEKALMKFQAQYDKDATRLGLVKGKSRQ